MDEVHHPGKLIISNGKFNFAKNRYKKLKLACLSPKDLSHTEIVVESKGRA